MQSVCTALHTDIHNHHRFRFYISNAKLQKQTHGCTTIAYLHVYRILMKTVIVTPGSNYLQLLFNNKQRAKFHAMLMLNPVSLWTALCSAHPTTYSHLPCIRSSKYVVSLIRLLIQRKTNHVFIWIVCRSSSVCAIFCAPGAQPQARETRGTAPFRSKMPLFRIHHHGKLYPQQN